MRTSSPRVIVITGAGKGIGYAIASRFARTGDSLVLIDRIFPKETNRELLKIAENSGAAVTFHSGDVSVPVDVHSIVDEAIERFGRIDVLVNNAGILRSGPSHETSWEEWQQVMNVNAGGTWNCIRACLPHMLAQRSGRIINISSELGIIGYPAYAAYAASKGAVIALTKSLAKEYAASGILVNSIAPGPVETDLLKYDSTEFNEETRNALPLRRFGLPDEIACSVEFLAGPGGSFYVGQIISPNGGAAI
jgi:3-oxoacyl-[acyl-carrier protein] reductase